MNKKICAPLTLPVLRKVCTLLAVTAFLFVVFVVNFYTHNAHAQSTDTGSITSMIFHDVNGNRVYDSADGDAPLTGVDVMLIYSDGTTETQASDADGLVSFDNLPHHTYWVVVDTSTLPAGKNEDRNDNKFATLTSINANPTLDFGYDLADTDVKETSSALPTGSIAHMMIHDVNGDGQYDPENGDFPLSGIDVRLFHSDGTMEMRTTGVDGVYSFDDLPVGDYWVVTDESTIPDGKNESNSANIPISPNVNPDPDFGDGANGDVAVIDVDNIEPVSDEIASTNATSIVPLSVGLLETTSYVYISKVGLIIVALSVLTCSIVLPIESND